MEPLVTPQTLATHWCTVEGQNPAHILDILFQSTPVETANGLSKFAGTHLSCPTQHRELLEDRAKLVLDVAAIAPSPASMCSLIVARRQQSPVAHAAFEMLREVLAPSVAGSLRCLRPDLQRFVASVAGVLSRACVDSRGWLKTAVATRWDVVPNSRTAYAISEMVAIAGINGKFVAKENASLALGGKIGVCWLPDDRILILLLLLFGPPAFFGSPPPCLPKSLSQACLPPWRNAVRFSSTTP